MLFFKKNTLKASLSRIGRDARMPHIHGSNGQMATSDYCSYNPSSNWPCDVTLTLCYCDQGPLLVTHSSNRCGDIVGPFLLGICTTRNRSVAMVKYDCNRVIFVAISFNSNNVTLFESGSK
jgi:hypothetical protein